MIDGLKEVDNAFLYPFTKALKPQKRLTVSQWADENRILTSKTSAEPGRWRTSRTPYLKEPMDMLSDHSEVEEIVVMKGAQVGFTEAGNNWLAYIIDHSPAPTMLVLPTDDIVKKNSKLRIDPLFEETASLKNKISKKKSRDSGNTVNLKQFAGGYLALVGANSPSSLRSLPIRRVFFDEVDAFPGDSGGEGDPVNLAKKRANTFSRKKFFLVSTPVDESTSRISRAFESSDKRYYHVPCPHCDHYQILKFENLKWEKGNPQDASFYCVSCGEQIQEHHKNYMLTNGKWVATNSENWNGRVVGYHLSSFYSPHGWLSWAEIAYEWELCQKNREALKTFVNTVLGETWKDKGEAPEWRKIYDNRENYKTNTIPDEVVFLTAAVDVQKDRLECEIKGWGRRKQSWSIDHRIFIGDTSNENAECYKQLTKVLAEAWEKNSITIGIQTMVIDSGYNTQTVYNYCRKFPMNRVRPIKGSDNISVILSIPRDVDVSYGGQKIKKGIKLWTVGSSVLKSETYGFLKQSPPTDEEKEKGEEFPDGYCHFPMYGEEFFKQLTAEELQVKLIRGHRKYEWVKVRDRNEALDLHIYNRAAASMVGMDRFKDAQWEQMEKQFAEPLKIKDNQLKLAKKPKKKRKKSDFW